MNRNKLIIIFSMLLLIVSCESLINTNYNKSKKTINSSFNFATTRDVEVLIATFNGDNPVSHVKFDILSGDKVIASGMTNINGEYNTSINMPVSETSIEIYTNNIFYSGKREIDIIDDEVNYIFEGFGQVDESNNNLSKLKKSSSITYTYLGAYDADGVPTDYLVNPGDVISNDLLQFINTNLPDGNNVPNDHPEYIVGTESDIILIKDADVWVTYVSEGGNYQNSLGFYTYMHNNPPTDTSQILEHKIIFPNTSLSGSGGNLDPGSKVHLGTFPSGTAIGWFLVSDGWIDVDNKVGDGVSVLYSNPDFNLNGNRQNVLLNYTDENKLILGFEDIERPGGDKDFNDVMFTVSSNPIDAIEVNNIYNPSGGDDDDGDGVSNVDDDYPNDPEKAWNNYINGTLAFEDLWPNLGDYDFNDLVVNYEFNRITKWDSVDNDPITFIEAEFTVVAAGATFENGFGLELSRLNFGDITSVYGTLPGGISAALEGGQTHPVVTLVNDVKNDLFGGRNKVNTIPNVQTVNSSLDIIKIGFELSDDSYTLTTVGTPPFNPFLIVNGNSDNRKEIHLTGLAPTDKGDVSLFGTRDDVSDPALNIYYKDINGMPWVLNMPGNFIYPIEDVDIRNTYLDFVAWASSGGTSNLNWYLNYVSDSIYVAP